jgi:cell division protein FtsN
VIVRVRPTHALPYLLAFVLGVGAAALTACGSTNKAMIPATNANRLKSDLDEVLNAIDDSDCTRSGRAIAQIRADLDSLPSGTSQRLEHRMREAVAKLSDQASTECQKTTPTETQATATTESTATTVETLPTTTTDTTATVPTTTTPTTTPTTTTPPTTTPTTTSDTGGAVTP